MKSLMEPIYEYLYNGFTFNNPSNPSVPYDVELDNSALALLLEQAAYRRFSQGVEHAFIFIDNANRKFNTSLEKRLLFQYYYLLILFHFERHDRGALEKSLQHAQIYFDKDQLEPEWSFRYQLLRAFCVSIENDGREEMNPIPLINEWISTKKESNNLLFSLMIYFGSWAVRNQKFEDAYNLLDSSLLMAQTTEQKVISFSNKGALSYRMNNITEAINFYKMALEQLEDSTLNQLDSGVESVRIMLIENLKNLEIQEATSRNKFYFPDPISIKENDIQFANRMRKIAINHLTDEVYNENLRGRNSFRASNNLYESFRYFDRAEVTYQMLGHIQGKKGLYKEQMMHFLNTGKALNQDILNRVALEQAILINHDKSIKSLLNDKIPFKDIAQINEFCDWLFSCGFNRDTRLGRTHCIGYFADYLPEKYLEKAYIELMDTLKEQWSLNKNSDFKRTAIEALRYLFPRLQPTQKVNVVTSVWQIILQEPPLVRENAAKNLSNIKDWSNFPQINEFITRIKIYIESLSKDSIEYNSLLTLLMEISKYSDRDEQKKTTIFLEKKTTEDSSYIIYPHLSQFAERKSKERALIEAMEQVEKEIREESLKSYSMTSRNWGAVLAFLLPQVKETPLFQNAHDLLLSYIDTPNIISYKRSSAFQAIFYLLKNHSDCHIDCERLLEICLRSLEESNTWKEDQSSFFNNDNALVTDIYNVLSLLELTIEKAESLIHRFMAETLMFEKESLLKSLIAMSNWSKKWHTSPQIYAPLLSRIYMECKNEDSHVRAAAVHGLVDLLDINFPDNTIWFYALNSLEITINDSYRFVRYNLATTLNKIWHKELDTDLRRKINGYLEILQSDISNIVREAASGFEEVLS
jgi:hypothetical protein